MCDYAEYIVETVNEFTRNKKLFTAWDITVELKKDSDGIKHGEVRKEVHNMFNSGKLDGYTRSLGNLPNLSLQPWVYHPILADVEEYGMPVSPKVDIKVRLPQDVYTFDSTNRLCIPAKVVRKLNPTSFARRVSVTQKSPDSIEVKDVTISGLLPVGTYSIDKYDNIRLPKAIFTKLGIVADKFEMTASSSSIVITKL